jgi:hypothetical protein
MARGIPGVDSSSPVTAALIQSATHILGQKPAFWGRYFKSPTAPGNVEYRHAQENPVLAHANVKLLPIARQTANVAGSTAQGTADARLNVADVLASIPEQTLVAQGGQFLMFLDVEGVSASAPSLSVAYYTGWAQTLISFSRGQTNNAVTLLPCVYARQLDNDTWHALVAAHGHGIPCHGAWVARYPHAGACVARDYDSQFAIPHVPLPFHVLVWQYDENCVGGVLDLNQSNPNIDGANELMSRLILPPSGS